MAKGRSGDSLLMAPTFSVIYKTKTVLSVKEKVGVEAFRAKRRCGNIKE